MGILLYFLDLRRSCSRSFITKGKARVFKGKRDNEKAAHAISNVKHDRHHACSLQCNKTPRTQPWPHLRRPQCLNRHGSSHASMSARHQGKPFIVRRFILGLLVAPTDTIIRKESSGPSSTTGDAWSDSIDMAQIAQANKTDAKFTIVNLLPVSRLLENTRL